MTRVAPTRFVGLAAIAFAASIARTTQADPSPSDPSAWSRTTPRPDPALTDPLVRQGKIVFQEHCRSCHAAVSGTTMRGFFPGTYALEMRYKGKLPAALEERTDLTKDRVSAVVRHGGGGFMPPLRPTELSDDDVRAVAAYLSRRTPNR